MKMKQLFLYTVISRRCSWCWGYTVSRRNNGWEWYSQRQVKGKRSLDRDITPSLAWRDWVKPWRPQDDG